MENNREESLAKLASRYNVSLYDHKYRSISLILTDDNRVDAYELHNSISEVINEFPDTLGIELKFSGGEYGDGDFYLDSDVVVEITVLKPESEVRGEIFGREQRLMYETKLREDRERAEYERLKKIYGDGN